MGTKKSSFANKSALAKLSDDKSNENSENQDEKTSLETAGGKGMFDSLKHYFFSSNTSVYILKSMSHTLLINTPLLSSGQ